MNSQSTTFSYSSSVYQVSVFSKDLREAAEVGSGTNFVGNYELHDLVQLECVLFGSVPSLMLIIA